MFHKFAARPQPTAVEFIHVPTDPQAPHMRYIEVEREGVHFGNLWANLSDATPTWTAALIDGLSCRSPDFRSVMVWCERRADLYKVKKG